jgi:hypothetical protein
MKKVLIVTILTSATILISIGTLSAQQTITKVATEEKAKAIEEMKESQKALEIARTNANIITAEGTNIFSTDGGNFYSPQTYAFSMRNQPRTSWDLSRNVVDDSSVKEYTFDLEKGMKSMSMSISGMCKTGEIRISILMPGGKSYSEVTIDEFGSLNWKKSFEMTEESKDKVGIWKFQVTTSKATGNVRLSLQSN